MEIKEEGASEEGQHFLPTAQANETRGTQFTSKYFCALPLQSKSLKKQAGSTKHNLCTHRNGSSSKWHEIAQLFLLCYLCCM
uniref:Uncharacterized protein n=1 Tax=Spermophilus dauricus TaxID=99837 RepID=A0A8C9PZU6_SPEDA